MKVVESPHKDWIDRRIWLDITTIGFGKVWDQMSLLSECAQLVGGAVPLFYFAQHLAHHHLTLHITLEHLQRV
jgi:hypothetical protein